MILFIDNYDSFSYNLLDLFYQLNQKVKLIKNDQHTLSEIIAMQPKAIILSPGPGHPKQAGCLLAVIQYFADKIPLLGVCLGHQAIAMAYGATIVPCIEPVHGKTYSIYHDQRTVFKGVSDPFIAMRYHSLMIDPATLPNSLEVSAQTADGIIMGIRHRQFAIEGLQFHPESILTQDGLSLINNFLKQYCGAKHVTAF